MGKWNAEETANAIEEEFSLLAPYRVTFGPRQLCYIKSLRPWSYGVTVLNILNGVVQYPIWDSQLGRWDVRSLNYKSQKDLLEGLANIWSDVDKYLTWLHTQSTHSDVKTLKKLGFCLNDYKEYTLDTPDLEIKLDAPRWQNFNYELHIKDKLVEGNRPVTLYSGNSLEDLLGGLG